eukprot:GILJ01034871.1.p1 GENE.GILJ01034871.1~~GILJ01034871.1.p1  ORF type:complete len:162 (-),score=18.08 GILJ01034871.1:285-770(-)
MEEEIDKLNLQKARLIHTIGEVMSTGEVTNKSVLEDLMASGIQVEPDILGFNNQFAQQDQPMVIVSQAAPVVRPTTQPRGIRMDINEIAKLVNGDIEQKALLRQATLRASMVIKDAITQTVESSLSPPEDTSTPFAVSGRPLPPELQLGMHNRLRGHMLYV